MNLLSSLSFRLPLGWLKSRVVYMLLLSAVALLASLMAQTSKDIPMHTLSLEEIAAERELPQLLKLLKSRQLEVTQQTNEVMKAQGSLEYEQSRSFGAIGRIWITFELLDGTARVHANFYYNKQGYILGRGLIVENVNIR